MFSNQNLKRPDKKSTSNKNRVNKCSSEIQITEAKHLKKGHHSMEKHVDKEKPLFHQEQCL